MKLIWLVDNLNFDIARNRLRVFHFARYFHQNLEFEPFITDSPSSVYERLTSDSILIISRKTDRAILSLLYKAYFYGVSIVADICDLPKNRGFFLHVFSLVDILVVPTYSLKNSILELSSEHMDKNKIKIVPDIAENFQTIFDTFNYLSSDKFVQDKKTYSLNLKSSINTNSIQNYIQASVADGPGEITILEYPYEKQSNLSLRGLDSFLFDLAIFQKTYGFKIVLFENCLPLAEKLKKTEGLKYEIVPYSLTSLITQLSRTTISIVAYGSNAFHGISSNFKELMSLANDIPVIAIKSSNNTELIDSVYLTFKDGMSATFDKKSPLPKLEPSKYFSKVSERFLLSTISELYSNILKSLICSKEVKSRTPINNKKQEVCNSDTSSLQLNSTQYNLAVIADSIPAKKILDIHKTWSERFIDSNIKFIHLGSPTLEQIEMYIKLKVIPYLLYSGKAENSYPLFFEDQYILYLEEDRQNQFIHGLESYQKIYLLPDQFITKMTVDSLEDFLISRSFELSNSPLERNSLTAQPSNEEATFGTMDLDLVVVVPIQNKGWILDGIAKEIVSRHSSSSCIIYSKNSCEPLPKSKHILFMHQSLLRKYFHNSSIDPSISKIACWYTHSSGENTEIIKDYICIFNAIHKVVFTCSANQKCWVDRGVDKSKTVVILGGYDSDLFLPHNRNPNQYIGLCSSYYERKNPMLMFDIIKYLPQYQFLLIGRNWEEFSQFEYLQQYGNLTYKQIKYKEYPYYYSKMDVFLSTSTLEGGPIPVLESMACNCFPVVSNTGFASDIIEHGKNGFLFDPNAHYDEVINLIIEAKSLSNLDISSSVHSSSWSSFVESFNNYVLS